MSNGEEGRVAERGGRVHTLLLNLADSIRVSSCGQTGEVLVYGIKTSYKNGPSPSHLLGCTSAAGMWGTAHTGARSQQSVATSALTPVQVVITLQNMLIKVEWVVVAL